MPLHFFVQTPVFSVSPSSFSLSPIYSQNILQRGIEQTLAQIEESSQDSVSPEPAAAEIPAASKWHIALMPANPEHKLSRNNVVVVDKTTRRVLLQAFRQGGVAKYIAELGTVFP